MRPLSLVGQQFGRLKVLRRAGKTKSGNLKWLCLCSCGNKSVVAGGNLKYRCIVSCGCYTRELCIARSTKHGLWRTPEYQAWVDLRRRCLNPKHPAYKNYGARGICVCKEWQGSNGFVNFLKHIGKRPNEEYSIDRINNDGHYEPGNVRWATRDQQQNNRRISKRKDSN